jgi:[acyl-carrier-protein] S-malonyltransferase
MIIGGATSFTEVGPGCVLLGLIKKVNKDIATEGATF